MKAKHVIAFILLYHCILINAQESMIVLDTAYTGNQSFIATEAICLNPGFSYTPSSGTCFLARTEAVEITSAEYLSEDEMVDPDTRVLDSSLPVGAIPGTFSINSTGAATYQVPIYVPPGTGGMVPSLSIIYNSQAGNGLLGYGFELAGLSSITRIKKPFKFNEFSDGITLTNDDGLALDGNMLILQTGTYGVDGSTYATELETYSIITLHGDMGGSVSWFEVELKNGNVIEYGNSSYSKIVSSNGALAFSWNINRITDRLGNYILFEYDYDNSSKQNILNCIRYTGNELTGLVPYNALYFSYQRRDDENEVNFRNRLSGIINQVVISQKLLLKSIQSMSEGKIIRSFTFNYASTTLSHLYEIVETDQFNNHMNSTLIKWGSKGDVGVIETAPASDFPDIEHLSTYRLWPGDFNGDGKEEFIAHCSPPPTVDEEVWQLFINQSTGLKMVDNGVVSNGDLKKFIICDRDNDGDDDILWETTEGTGDSKKHILKAYIYDSGRLERTTDLDVYEFVDYDEVSVHIVMGDFDGNTSTDFLFLDEENSLIGPTGIECDNQDFPDLCPSDQVLIADFNGNGKSDIINFNDGDITIYEFDISQGSFMQIASYVITTDSLNIYSGDFNGDLKADLLIYNVDDPIDSKILYSTGYDFLEANFEFGREPDQENYIQYHITDFNGDGLSDILEIEINPDPNTSNSISSMTIQRLLLSTGIQFRENIISGFEQESTSHCLFYHFIDNNHDGRMDLKIDHGEYECNWNILPDYGENTITSITNGLGLQYQIEYKYTTDSELYSGPELTYSSPVRTYYKPVQVVSDYRTYDVNNSEIISEVEMHYYDLRIHTQGLGFLGFKEITAFNLTTQTSTRTEYSFDPYYYNVYVSRISNGANGIATSRIYYSQITGALDLGRRFYTYTNNIVTENITKIIKKENIIELDDSGNKTFEISKTMNLSDELLLQIEETYSGFNSFGEPSEIITSKTYNGNNITRSTTKSFLSNGLVSGEVVYLGSSPLFEKDYSYDSYGNVLTATTTIGSSSRTNTYSYEETYGRYLKSEEDPFGNVKRYFYDTPVGYLKQTQEQYKTTGTIFNTYFEYDGFGNLIQTTYPDLQVKNQSTTLSINETGLGDVYKTQVQSDGHPTIVTYYNITGKELRHKTTSFNNGSYIITDTEYNTKGQILKKYKPRFEGEEGTQYTSFEYNIYGQVTSEQTFPSGSTTTYSYNGRVTNTTKAGRAYQTIDNVCELRISATDPGGTINYTYNPDGKLIEISSPSGTITMEYDDYGNQIRLVDPDAGEINYTYNGFGDLLEQVDEKNNQVNFTYDNNGKIISEIWSTGLTKTFAYNTSTGLLEKVTSSDGQEINYSYDDLQRKTFISRKYNESNIFSKAFTYNAYGNIATVTTNSSVVETYVYDTYGYQTQHLVNGTLVWKGISQNKNGVIGTYKLREDNETAYNYFDSNGFPSAVNYYNTNGILEVNIYNFNPSTGNMVFRQQYTGSGTNLYESFTYDDQDRLVSYAVANEVTHNIAYNASGSGDITSKTDVGNYNYEESTHAPHSITEPTDLLLAYPAQQISFNQSNKIESLAHTDSDNSVKALEWTYWPDNERAAQKYYLDEQLISTKYYSFGDYEKEETSMGTRELYYINTPSGTVAVVEVQSGSTDIYYIHKDLLGSFSFITSSNGEIIERNSFDPWGRRRNPSDWTYDDVTDVLLTGRGFTGHEHLLDFDLINMNGRIYDPILAMFLSPDNFVQDPAATIGLNRYTYCLNNPLKYTDPSGELGILAQMGLYYLFNWLNNVLGLGMTPSQAFRSTPISVSGYFNKPSGRTNEYYFSTASFSMYSDDYLLLQNEYEGQYGLGGPPTSQRRTYSPDTPIYISLLDPTGLGIRLSDLQGSGLYAASRIGHIHLGLDFISVAGQKVFAPISGRAFYFRSSSSGNGWNAIRIFPDMFTQIKFVDVCYIKPPEGSVLYASIYVTRGQSIGTALDLSTIYKNATGMTNHVHLQVKYFKIGVGNVFVDPLPFFLPNNNTMFIPSNCYPW